MGTGTTAPRTGQRRPAWAWAAVAIAIIDTAVLTAALAVAAASGMHLPIVEDDAWINLVAGPAFPLLAALMLRTRGRDPDRPAHQDRLAWLFAGFGVLCTATIALHIFVVYSLDHHGPLTLAGAWISGWLWTAVIPGLLLALLWFPDGDVPGPRWRWAVRGVAISWAAIWLAIAFQPGPMPDFDGRIANPAGWTGAGPALHGIGAAGVVTLAVTAIGAIASVGWRFYRGNAAVRAQLRWLLATVAVIAVTIALPSPMAISPVILVLHAIAVFLLPVTLAVTLVGRDGLVLPRLLLYGSLSALLLAAYIAVVGLAQAVFGSRADPAAAVVAAGLIAVLAAPLRARLQRSVDGWSTAPAVTPTPRWPTSAAVSPAAPVTCCTRSCTPSPMRCAHLTPRSSCPAMPRRPPAPGLPSQPEIVVPLSLRGTQAGSLIVAQRSPKEHYSERDLALLDDLARHIAVAAHAAALTRTCSAPANRWSPRGRKSGGASAVISTTGLARRWPGSRSAWTRRATPWRPTRRPRPRRWPNSKPRCRPPSPMSAGSSTTCGRLPWTSSAWCPRCSSMPPGSPNAARWTSACPPRHCRHCRRRSRSPPTGSPPRR